MGFFNSSSEIVEFTRIYLAVFYLCVAFFYTIRILVAKSKSKKELVFSGTRFSPTWWNHIVFRIFRVTILMVCVFRFYFPSVDNYLGNITSFQSPPIIISGIVLLSLAFVLTLIIHFSMGSKWRSGIDPKGPKHLIIDGFYNYSRNPMFMCIGISQLGFFLALPSIFSLVCLIIGLYTLHRQTLSEEKHLLQIFLVDYKKYKINVRRWL